MPSYVCVAVSSLRHHVGVNIPQTQVRYTKQTRPFLSVRRVGSARLYITLTCHLIDNDWKFHSFVLTTTEVAEDHTSENLVIVLDTIMKEWEIRETVVGASTDNGSNIVKAVREMDLFNMPCVGHTVNLAAKKVI